MSHDINSNEHRAECRACRQAYRAPNSPGFVPLKGMHPHGDDPGPLEYERCPNILCKNPRVPKGRMTEHYTRYPRCCPNPLAAGWTKNAFGDAGAFQLVHEYFETLVDGRRERVPCRQTVLAATEADIPLKIASHVMKRHKS